MKEVDFDESPGRVVKELVSRYISKKPTKITLNLYEERSLINLKGDDLNETTEYRKPIAFYSFALGVIEAYEAAYGKLKVVPISFREEIYKNDRVAIDLYPTGSVGIFDVFISYR